ncbi:MAG: thrombospondin type 3 repeat-containing protein [Deltaproteobacteria bacterium]|nr:thrombospondin type 3 repeat-containing protein [Deltaproteobacteria bacterium]
MLIAKLFKKRTRGFLNKGRKSNKSRPNMDLRLKIIMAIYPELDEDRDLVPDVTDNCPNTFNPSQLDTDGAGAGDACDNDDDNDGLPDNVEPVYGTNPLKADTDGDNMNDLDEINAGRNPLVNEVVVLIGATS